MIVKERKEILGYIPFIYKKFIRFDINHKRKILMKSMKIKVQCHFKTRYNLEYLMQLNEMNHMII